MLYFNSLSGKKMQIKKNGLDLILECIKVDHGLETNIQNSTKLQTFITLFLHLWFEQNYHQKKHNFNSFQQCDEKDWLENELRMCKSRLLSRNQLQILNLPPNAHNFANTT